MLSPDDRSLLADLLMPPPGYRLEHALATTFTLDLTALLTVPLGFAGADLVANTNHLAVLQAVREYADRVDVFAQRGMLKVPDKPNSLLAFIEQMIHPVGVPRPGALFHPKVWVLRFSSVAHSDDEGQRFRLVCGSRNLTFDRSWDAAIILDGEERNRRYAVNNPLCSFLRSLPERAAGLGPQRRTRLDETVRRLNNVEWEMPDGVADVSDWLTFHVFGQSASPQPDTSGKRTLVISPFLNGEGLRKFEECNELHVISRGEQFDSLDEGDRHWLSDPKPSLFTLDDDASIRDLEDEESGVRWELTGLHAKIYAFDRGHYTHVMIGSANATDAGWSGNDEFMVEIVGKRRVYGIDTLIGDGSPLRKILIEHAFGQRAEMDPEDDLRRMLENKIRDLAAIEFVGILDGNDADGWTQTVRTSEVLNVSIPDVELTLSLVTRPTERRQLPLGRAVDERWQLLGLNEATPFVVIELKSAQVKASSVLLAKIQGAPTDRVDRVLAQQFSNPESFLQFVALLLALATGDGSVDPEVLLGGDSGFLGSWAPGRSGLLEGLLRAISRSPRSIDDVAKLVLGLQATEEGRKSLPEGWDELWASVMDARTRLGMPA